MNYFYICLIPFILSLFISIIILNFWEKFFSFGEDRYDEIQKIHNQKAFRLGGITILISLTISFLIMQIEFAFLYILFCMIPFLMVGLAEDLKGNIDIKVRLLSIFLSTILVLYFYGSVLNQTDNKFLDYYFTISGFPFVFTLLGIASTSIAWNFIDGLNGLSSGLGFIILIILSILAFNTGLTSLYLFLTILSFSILGFWVVNITTGKFFLGDLGSMFIGFVIGLSGVEIVNNSEKFSSWGVFLIIIYPAIEIIFSITRRVVNKKNPFKADDLHLHTILFKIMSKKFDKFQKKTVNTLAGLVITFFASIPVFISFYFQGNYPMTLLFPKI